MHIYLAGHTDHSQTDKSTHKKTNSTKSLILLPSLLEQDGGLLVRTCVAIYSCV